MNVLIYFLSFLLTTLVLAGDKKEHLAVPLIVKGSKWRVEQQPTQSDLEKINYDSPIEQEEGEDYYEDVDEQQQEEEDRKKYYLRMDCPVNGCDHSEEIPASGSHFPCLRTSDGSLMLLKEEDDNRFFSDGNLAAKSLLKISTHLRSHHYKLCKLMGIEKALDTDICDSGEINSMVAIYKKENNNSVKVSYAGGQEGDDILCPIEGCNQKLGRASGDKEMSLENRTKLASHLIEEHQLFPDKKSDEKMVKDVIDIFQNFMGVSCDDESDFEGVEDEEISRWCSRDISRSYSKQQ